VDFIAANPAEARAIAAKWTKLDAAIIDDAFQRVKYTYSLNSGDIRKFVSEIISLGESGAIKPIITANDVPDLDNFVEMVVDTKYLTR
jgi:ABC-type nitrate/sulfonate/bicarbonate transport system substrate-binding protein